MTPAETAHDRYVHVRQGVLRELAHPDALQQLLAAIWLAYEAKRQKAEKA